MNAKTNDTSPGYDGDLQMFRVQTRELNIDKLRFLRWLAEHNQLEHAVAGPSMDERAVSTAA